MYKNITNFPMHPKLPFLFYLLFFFSLTERERAESVDAILENRFENLLPQLLHRAERRREAARVEQNDWDDAGRRRVLR